ncbi:hypothetical protein BsWGS_03062 [Bradybaena similaris]
MLHFHYIYQLKYSGKYTRQEIREQKKYDWSIIRDEILLQEAVIFQPRVLLKRFDDPCRSTNLPSVSTVTGFTTKQAPVNLTDPNEQITSKSLPHLESKGRVILKLLEKPLYSPSLVTQETSYEYDRQKSPSSSVSCQKLPEVPNIDGLCTSQLQQHRTTSAISEDNIMADNSGARKLTVVASPDGENFEIGDTHEVSSLMTPDSLPESVSKPNMSAVVFGHEKDVSKEHEAVDTVTDRLVSRYSGRKIRRNMFSSYSYSALGPKAKKQRWPTTAPQKDGCEPSQVSVFICGHLCAVCNATKRCKWLRDHEYSKIPPLCSAKGSEIQELMKDGTSSVAVLILKKLAELNYLLQGNSNMLLELKTRPLQHEFLNTTEPSSSNSEDTGPSTYQTASDAVLHQSSKHEVLSDAVNTSLSGVVNTSLSDAVNTSLSDAVNTSLSNAVNTSLNDAVNTSLNDAVNTSLSDAVNTSLSDAVNTSLSDAVNTSLSDAVNTSLSNVCSILPNDILLGQSPQLLQQLQINTTNTSQPAVCSFPLTCTDMLMSLQQPLESMGRQSPQPAVTTTDLAHSFNTTLLNCL